MVDRLLGTFKILSLCLYLSLFLSLSHTHTYTKVAKYISLETIPLPPFQGIGYKIGYKKFLVNGGPWNWTASSGEPWLPSHTHESESWAVISPLGQA